MNFRLESDQLSRDVLVGFDESADQMQYEVIVALVQETCQVENRPCIFESESHFKNILRYLANIATKVDALGVVENSGGVFVELLHSSQELADVVDLGRESYWQH